jgi:transcriptional regulator with XRE-family HTH domain
VGSRAAAKPPEVDEAQHEIGLQLRAERERQGISLRKLSKAVGISPSALSQIETSRSRPSVNTLYSLVSELGLSLDELFAGDQRRVVVERARRVSGSESAVKQARGQGVQSASDRKVLTLESGVIWERLTPTSEPDVDFLYVTYEVGGASSPGGKFVRHEGREYGLVLEGKLRVTVGFDTYDLGPGDSIAFDSFAPHRLENVGNKPARAVWVALGRYGSDPRSDGLHDG